MGGYFSKIGSDPYYANYEKSFQRLKTDIDKLKDKQRVRQRQRSRIGQTITFWGLALFVLVTLYSAWVLRQPQGTYTPQQHALRVSPILVEPASAFGLHYCVFGLLRLRNRRLDRRLKSLNKKMKQLIHDLKDSTRYEKTHQLLEKYDPDYTPLTPRGTPRNAPFGSAKSGVQHRNVISTQAHSNAGSLSPAAFIQRTAGAAGSKMIPVLNSLAGMVGDNPDLMHNLNDAKSEALKLKAENEQLRQKVCELKARLGEDASSEQDLSSPRYPAHTAVRSLNKEDLAEAPGTQTGAADSVRGEHDNNRFQSAIHTQLEPDANSVESHIGNTEGKKSR